MARVNACQSTTPNDYIYLNLSGVAIPVLAGVYVPQEAMKAAPDITKVKTVLRDILSDGDQTGIAAMLGVTHQDISQRYSPGSTRKTGWQEALREGWAIAIVNPEAGWKLKAYVDGLFDSWLSPVKATEKNLTALIRDAQENMTALVSAKLDNKPLAELREEGRAARGAIDQLLAALDLEFELRSQKVADIRR